MANGELERLVDEAIRHVQDSNEYNPKQQAQLEHAFLGVLVKIRSFDRKVKRAAEDASRDGAIRRGRERAGGA